MMTTKKIYLAGPMQGYKDFNFPAFFRAAEDLRARGFEVFSPAERDIEVHGEGVYKGNETGDVAQAAADSGFCLRSALAADTDYIAREATTIALLPGWEHSSGALAEWSLAKALKLEFMYL
jgi:hypothetical protein